ncbi:purine-nucleoside phosphorylase [Terriglobus aquaticus]|nr:purine nucleoside permease [Terriglobus aquaticus]
MHLFRRSTLALALLCGMRAVAQGPSATGQRPIPVKAVVVTMFEIGKDTGDAPGEFQYWVEREHLNHRYALPAAYHDALMNDDGVLGIVTGMGTLRASSTIMALGLDPRFDLSHAYWIVAGIGGIDPQAGTLGSAVWSDWIVDGDYAYEFDAREIPKDWSTGYVPLRKKTPYEEPRTDDNGMAFQLNSKLVDWAVRQTEHTPLMDLPGLQERRLQFAGDAAHTAPRVQRGTAMSSSTYYHGRKLSEWARAWVRYQTGGKGTYAISGMEDSGTLYSLSQLAKTGRVDMNRVLVLRTASNFDQQPASEPLADEAFSSKIASYSALQPSLENAFRVGDAVVHELVQGWPKYRDTVPAAQ